MKGVDKICIRKSTFRSPHKMISSPSISCSLEPEQFQVTAKKTSVMGTRQTAVNVHRNTPSLLARFPRLARKAGIATTILAIELEAVYRYFIVRHTIVQPSFGDSKNEEALGEHKF